MSTIKKKLLLLGGVLSIFVIGVFFYSVIATPTSQVTISAAEDLDANREHQISKIEETTTPQPKVVEPPPRDIVKAKKLIDRIHNEIKRKDFKTDIRNIKNWSQELEEKYNYRLPSAISKQINDYKSITKVVYNIRAKCGANNKNCLIENLSKLQVYMTCKKRYYTKEQEVFLLQLIAKEKQEGVQIWGADNFKFVPNCSGKTMIANESKIGNISKANEARKLIDLVMNEIKRRDFMTNFSNTIDIWTHELIQKYNYQFPHNNIKQINDYKNIARVVYILRGRCRANDKNCLIENLSKLKAYMTCKKKYYTKEQEVFLLQLIAKKRQEGVQKWGTDNFKIETDCSENQIRFNKPDKLKANSDNNYSKALPFNIKDAKRLIDLVELEIKRKTFKSNLNNIDEWMLELAQRHNYQFPSDKIKQIRDYRSIAIIVYSVRAVCGSDNKNCLIENLSKLLGYMTCKKKYYTKEQENFLVQFIAYKESEGIDKWGSDNFKIESNCD